MTSTKLQINYNIQKFNACTELSRSTCAELSRSNQNSFVHLVIDIWILFVICFLRFVIYHLALYLRKCLTLFTLYILAFTGIALILSGCEKENKAPDCTITDPKNSEEIPHGTQVIISVDADDADGIVVGVNFLINDSSIGISNSLPYNYEWNTLNEETGSHTIKAIATDDSGNSLSDKKTVSITEGVPLAEFVAYHTSISAGSSAQFYNRSINNTVSWLWDFGDGNTSVSQNPSHTYSTGGTYTVSLTVTNSYGSDTETKTGYLTVTDPIIDYDGNIYQTVQIGNQLWMKENLKTTHYADGTALTDGKGAGDISGDTTTKYYFAYYDNESYVAVYGRLYTWAAVMNGASGSETNPDRAQGVCPDGWHVPGDDEWKELEMHLGMSEKEANTTNWRGTDEGAKLKESGFNGLWRYSGTLYIGNNKSGFTALPAGSRLYNESFRNLGERANFWSATESFSSYAWCRRLYYNYAEVYRYDDYKSRGYSVRCVKD